MNADVSMLGMEERRWGQHDARPALTAPGRLHAITPSGGRRLVNEKCGLAAQIDSWQPSILMSDRPTFPSFRICADIRPESKKGGRDIGETNRGNRHPKTAASSCNGEGLFLVCQASY